MESNCNLCMYCGKDPKAMNSDLCNHCANELAEFFHRELGGMHWDIEFMGTENSICSICFNPAGYFEPTLFPLLYYCSSCKIYSANPISINFKHVYLITGMNLRIIEERLRVLSLFDEHCATIKAQFTAAEEKITTHSQTLTITIDKMHKTKQELLGKLESDFNRACTEVFIESSQDEINNNNTNFMKNVSDMGAQILTQELLSPSEMRESINCMFTLEFEDINLLVPEKFLCIPGAGIKIVYLEQEMAKNANLEQSEEVFQECSFQLLPSGKYFFCGGAKNLTAHNAEMQGKCFILTPSTQIVRNLPPCSPRRSAAVVVANSQVFVFGGMTNSCQKFEIKAETWEDIAQLPFESRTITGIFEGNVVKLMSFEKERMYEYDIYANIFREKKFKFISNAHKVLLADGQNVFCLINGKIMQKGETDSSWNFKGKCYEMSNSWSNNGWMAHNDYIYFSDGAGGICRLDTVNYLIEKVKYREA